MHVENAQFLVCKSEKNCLNLELAGFKEGEYVVKPVTKIYDSKIFLNSTYRWMIKFKNELTSTKTVHIFRAIRWIF